jgi:antitoxin HicB
MSQEKLAKAALASKLHTSRSSLERILDPENTSITLHSLVKTAAVLGKKVNVSLIG